MDGVAPGLLPPITATDIRRAARTFPEGTAIGPDGWKPRDIGLLSDDALAPLAGLLNAAEIAAYPLGDLVDIVFLPKPGGGEAHRPYLHTYAPLVPMQAQVRP